MNKINPWPDNKHLLKISNHRIHSNYHYKSGQKRARSIADKALKERRRKRRKREREREAKRDHLNTTTGLVLTISLALGSAISPELARLLCFLSNTKCSLALWWRRRPLCLCLCIYIYIYKDLGSGFEVWTHLY